MFQTSKVHFRHLYQKQILPPKFYMQGKKWFFFFLLLLLLPFFFFFFFSRSPKSQMLCDFQSPDLCQTRSASNAFCKTLSSIVKTLLVPTGVFQIIFSFIYSNCFFFCFTLGLTQFLFFRFFLQPKNIHIKRVFPLFSVFTLGVK